MSGQVLDFNAARPQGEAPQSITADSIRSEITARAREFVEWMFPCAVVDKRGKIAYIGDIYGQPGDSLEIELLGAKAGHWNDWASTSDGGRDLIGLFLATNDFSSNDFPRALEIIHSEFLGRITPEWTRKFTIQFKERAKEHADKPRPQIEDRPPPTESYVYRDTAGGIIGVVKRHEYEGIIDPETGKNKKTFSVWDATVSKAQAPIPRPLYRLPEIIHFNELIFTEGEKKADALASIGIEATCIMGGAKALLDKVDWKHIAGKKITIWPDKDDSGFGFAERLAPHLTKFGCEIRIVEPPAEKPKKWDAADCIAEGGDPVVLLEAAKPYQSKNNGAAEKPVGIPLQSAFPITESAIPPRDWIIPSLLLKRHLSVLVAPPGSGKSLLTLQLAIAVATGKSWGGWKVRERKKILVVNSEDDVDEMRRRLFAAAKDMKVNQDELSDWLYLATDPESIVIARADSKTKTVVRTPLLEELVHTMINNEIGCAFVDPFAETFEGDENANSEIKWAGILWREVARRTNASVMLVHHTKKYAGGMAGDADASRGGGALIGTARILSTLFSMTEEEASTFNVMPEDRTRYVRFDDAKANLSLITGQAKWFEKKSIAIANGNQFIPGDEVGVLAPWEPPGMLDGVSVFTIGQVLDTIDRGLMDADGAPTGQFYTANASGPSKDRWAGTVITRLLGCEEKHAKRLLKDWLKNEVLETYEYTDPVARKARNGVRSILNNRPDRAPK